REEGAPGKGNLLAVGRLKCDALDLGPVQTEVAEFAIGQVGKFAHRLAIDRVPQLRFTDALEEGRDAVSDATTGAGNVYICHFMPLCSCSGDRCRAVRANMDLMLQMHNRRRDQCCYAASAWLVMTGTR